MAAVKPLWVAGPEAIDPDWLWAWDKIGAIYLPGQQGDPNRIRDFSPDQRAGDITVLDSSNVGLKATPYGQSIANTETGSGATNFDFEGADGSANGFWHKSLPERTWMFYVTVDAKSAGGQVVFEEGGATTGMELEYRVSPETFRWLVRHQNSDVIDIDPKTTAVGVGETVLVTCVINDGDCELWIGDYLEGSASLTTTLLDDHTDDPSLFQTSGSAPGSFSNQSPWTLHAMYVWDRALSGPEIRKLVADPFGPIRPALWHPYMEDAGAGGTALTGTLFTASPQFNTGTVTPGSVALTGTLFTANPQFNTGTVAPAATALTGTLFTASPQFNAGTVDSTVALTGVLLAASPQFNVGTVDTGAVALTGTLFTASPSFGVGTVDTGAIALTGTTFTAQPAFYVGDMGPPADAEWTGSTPADGTTHTVVTEDTFEFRYGGGVLATGGYNVARIRGVEIARYQFTSGLEEWSADANVTVTHDGTEGALRAELTADNVNGAFENVSARTQTEINNDAPVIDDTMTFAVLARWKVESGVVLDAPHNLAVRFYYYDTSGNFLGQDAPAFVNYTHGTEDFVDYYHALIHSAELTPATGALRLVINVVTDSDALDTGDAVFLDELIVLDTSGYSADHFQSLFTDDTWIATNTTITAGSPITSKTFTTDHVEGISEATPANFKAVYIASAEPAGATNGMHATEFRVIETTNTQALTGTTFTSSPSFPGGVVGQGATPLQGVLFTASPQFNTGTVTPGAVALTGTLFTSSPSFLTGVVAPQAVAVTGVLFTSSPSFPTGAIAQGNNLVGQLFIVAPSFPTGTVTTGTVAVTGVLFTSSPSFGTGAVNQPSLSAQTLTSSAPFIAKPTFQGGLVLGGIVTITAKQHCIFFRSGSNLTLLPFGRGQFDGFAGDGAERASSIFTINSGTQDKVMEFMADIWAAEAGAAIGTLKTSIDTRLQNAGYRTPTGNDLI